MDGLLSFFEATGQTDVNLFGVDVNVLFWGLDNQKKEILFPGDLRKSMVSEPRM